VAAYIGHRKNGSGLSIPYGQAADYERVFEAYGQRLRQAALLDFDDLLGEALRLLQECPGVTDLYRARFSHVLVDEYQDTNGVQRRLLLQLAGPQGNVTVVGDPDQSIYRWRGALIGNILDFPEDFPGAGTVLLERNYRSTGNILAAAEAVISRNCERHAKRLVTRRPAGSKVLVLRARDGLHEGRLVCAQVAQWMEAGRRPEDIAIFYRVNALSRGIELALGESGIPYVVVAGTEFFQRREVKDVLAYARLIQNPRDEAAFMRVVNVPRRGVGKASLTKVRQLALQRGCSLLEAATHCDEAGVKGRAAKGLERFRALLERVAAMPRAPVAPLLVALVEGSGYQAVLEESADALDRSRLENVGELVAYAREFATLLPGGELLDFLERTSLVSDQDGYERGSGAVSLMSVHAAKGLEFPCVLIVGAENGYFPHARNSADPSALEEERRLFYVAMTRAQDALVATYTAGRSTYAGPERRRPSPYLGDIPEPVLEHRDLANDLCSTPWRAGPSGPPDTFPPEGHPPEALEGGEAGWGLGTELDAAGEGQAGYCVGERVLHPHYGAGRLTALGGQGAETRLTVDFDGAGRRQFLLRYANLEKLT